MLAVTGGPSVNPVEATYLAGPPFATVSRMVAPFAPPLIIFFLTVYVFNDAFIAWCKTLLT